MAGLQRWQRVACAQVQSYEHIRPSNPRSSNPCLKPLCGACAYSRPYDIHALPTPYTWKTCMLDHACLCRDFPDLAMLAAVVVPWPSKSDRGNNDHDWRDPRALVGALCNVHRLWVWTCQIEISPCLYVDLTITFSYRGRKAQWQISQAYLLTEISAFSCRQSHGHFERVFPNKTGSLDFDYNIMNCVNAL